jgi:hypothetical protein
MDKTFKLTLRSQMFIVYDFILFVIIGFLFFEAVIYFRPDGKDLLLKIYLIGFLGLELLPTILIYIQYYIFSQGMEIGVNNSDRTINIRYDGNQRNIAFSEVKFIEVRFVPSLYSGRKRGMNVWEIYHYAVIETMNGERFVITCLLINKIENTFKDLGIEVRRKMIWFPFVRGNYVNG